MPCPPSPRSQAQYAVLKRDELKAKQRKAVAEVTSVLGLTDDEAIRVLRRFKWCERAAGWGGSLPGGFRWQDSH